MVRSTIHSIPGATGRHRPEPGHPGCRGIPVAGEDTRYSGTVRQSPRTCRRAVGGRKAADPGAVAHTEATADAAGHSRTRTHACGRNGTACRWTFMSSPAMSPPRVGRGSRVAGKACPVDLPPRADLRLPDERGGGHFLQTGAAASTERRLRIDRRLHPGGRGMAWAPQRKQGLRVTVGRETGGACRVLEAWPSINIE